QSVSHGRIPPPHRCRPTPLGRHDWPAGKSRTPAVLNSGPGKGAREECVIALPRSVVDRYRERRATRTAREICADGGYALRSQFVRPSENCLLVDHGYPEEITSIADHVRRQPELAEQVPIVRGARYGLDDGSAQLLRLKLLQFLSREPLRDCEPAPSFCKHFPI